MEIRDRIAHGYFFAKSYIIKKGYANEIDWQDELDYDSLTEQKFLEEFSWVVIASGLNDKVVRKTFPAIKKNMFDFKSCELIVKQKKKCMINGLEVFNHKGKINAILFAAEYIHKHSFEMVKLKIMIEGVNFIQTFPYMGKATAYHLAKNLGLNVAKPDRHLIRISNLLGYEDPNTFCKDLSFQIEEKISLIDLVLWRYATIDRNYIKNIRWYLESNNNEHSS